MRARRAASAFPAIAAFLLGLPSPAPAQNPGDFTIRMFAKPEGGQLHVLVRVPFRSLNSISFPAKENGELDLARAEATLPSAARWWVAQNIELYEDGDSLPKPTVTEARVSLPGDDSFASYEQARAHLSALKLAGDTQVSREQAMFDVLLDYPIRSTASDFAMHSKLAQLGTRVSSDVTYIPPQGPLRNFEYTGDPGMFRFNPRWAQVLQQFVSLGFFHLIKGTDYLLFFLCAALLLSSFRALLPFVAAFTAAHSFTLIGSAYRLTPDALWFSVVIQILTAFLVLYLTFEIIVFGTEPDTRSSRRHTLLAFASGLVYGISFSFAHQQALQFAGSHMLTSVLSFNLGIEGGQLLALALLVPALHLLFRFTTGKHRVETIIIAALAADISWHRLAERVERFSQFGFRWPALDAALLAAGMRGIATLLLLLAWGYVVMGTLEYCERRSAARFKSSTSSS